MPELVFVYNADDGVFSRALDAAHKALSPQTYQCDLCKLTHGTFGEKKRWKEFVESLPVPVRFLHRAEANREWPQLRDSWPAVLWIRTDATRPVVLIDSPTLAMMRDENELMGVLGLHFANAYSPVNRKPVLGLTGLPGSGKSTVAALLAERGGAVVDADALARAAFDEPAVRSELREAFGDGVFREDGSPDRAALAKIVFTDADAKATIEAIIHPRVFAGRVALHEKYANDSAVRFIVEDCPLLIETGLHEQCDHVLLVDAPRTLRLARLAASRGWDDAELARRDASQFSFDRRRAHADVVLDNAGDRGALAGQVDAALRGFGLDPAATPAEPL